jgi:acyl dehydratase
LTESIRAVRVRLVTTTDRRGLPPGTPLPEHRIRVRNLFRDAANRIHDDAVARQHGYAGALVAGVTIYGYLTRVAVQAWGAEWVRRGTASVRFLRPLYDGETLAIGGRAVGRSATDAAGEGVIEVEGSTAPGEIAVAMTAGLAWGGAVVAPDPRGYPAGPPPAALAPATAAGLAALGVLGSPVLALDEATLVRAADDLDDPSPLYRGAEGVAHPGLLLRQANRALAENVALGPWIHVASDVAHCGLARAGDRLETRGRVLRIYERKGRGWVDLDVVIVANDARPIARVHHTAIYRLDGAPTSPPPR